jgi:hypothetical protein
MFHTFLPLPNKRFYPMTKDKQAGSHSICYWARNFPVCTTRCVYCWGFVWVIFTSKEAYKNGGGSQEAGRYQVTHEKIDLVSVQRCSLVSIVYTRASIQFVSLQGYFFLAFHASFAMEIFCICPPDCQFPRTYKAENRLSGPRLYPITFTGDTLGPTNAMLLYNICIVNVQDCSLLHASRHHFLTGNLI